MKGAGRKPYLYPLICWAGGKPHQTHTSSSSYTPTSENELGEQSYTSAPSHTCKPFAHTSHATPATFASEQVTGPSEKQALVAAQCARGCPEPENGVIPLFSSHTLPPERLPFTYVQETQARSKLSATHTSRPISTPSSPTLLPSTTTQTPTCDPVLNSQTQTSTRPIQALQTASPITPAPSNTHQISSSHSPMHTQRPQPASTQDLLLPSPLLHHSKPPHPSNNHPPLKFLPPQHIPESAISSEEPELRRRLNSQVAESFASKATCHESHKTANNEPMINQTHPSKTTVETTTEPTSVANRFENGQSPTGVVAQSGRHAQCIHLDPTPMQNQCQFSGRVGILHCGYQKFLHEHLLERQREASVLAQQTESSAQNQSQAEISQGNSNEPNVEPTIALPTQASPPSTEISRPDSSETGGIWAQRKATKRGNAPENTQLSPLQGGSDAPVCDTLSDGGAPVPPGVREQGEGVFKRPYPVAKGKRTPTPTPTQSPSPLAKKRKKRIAASRPDSVESAESVTENESPQPTRNKRTKTANLNEGGSCLSDDEPLKMRVDKGKKNPASVEEGEVDIEREREKALSGDVADPEIDFPYDGPVYVGEEESTDSELDLEEIKKGREFPKFLRPFLKDFEVITDTPALVPLQCGWERHIRLRPKFNRFRKSTHRSPVQADVYYYNIPLGVTAGLDRYKRNEKKQKEGIEYYAKLQNLEKKHFDTSPRHYIPGTHVYWASKQTFFSLARYNRHGYSRYRKNGRKPTLCGHKKDKVEWAESRVSGGDFISLVDVIISSDQSSGTDSD